MFPHNVKYPAEKEGQGGIFKCVQTFWASELKPSPRNSCCYFLFFDSSTQRQQMQLLCCLPLDKHSVNWMKGRMVWSYLPLPPAGGGDPSSPRLCSDAHSLPPHARNVSRRLTPWAVSRHTQKVWKPKQAPDRIFPRQVWVSSDVHHL